MSKLVHLAGKANKPASQGVKRVATPALTKAQEIRKRVASRVRRLRYIREYSQAKAAMIAGVDERTWQKLEREQLNATLDMLTKVANALDVSPEELVGFAEPVILAKSRR